MGIKRGAGLAFRGDMSVILYIYGNAKPTDDCRTMPSTRVMYVRCFFEWMWKRSWFKLEAGMHQRLT